jgi:hypothetical protein
MRFTEPAPDLFSVQWHEQRLFQAALPLDQAAHVFGLNVPSGLDLVPSFAAQRIPDLLVTLVRGWPADAIERLKRVEGIVSEKQPGPVYSLFRINGMAPGEL